MTKQDESFKGRDEIVAYVLQSLKNDLGFFQDRAPMTRMQYAFIQAAYK